eukprot:2780306-Rhodomonas_salina.1
MAPRNQIQGPAIPDRFEPGGELHLMPQCSGRGARLPANSDLLCLFQSEEGEGETGRKGRGTREWGAEAEGLHVAEWQRNLRVELSLSLHT